jgi:hypothetical protein
MKWTDMTVAIDEALHKWKHETWYNEGAAREGKYYYRCQTCNERKWLAKVPDIPTPQAKEALK